MSEEMKKVETLLLDILQGIVRNPDDIDLHFSDDTDEQGEMTVINVRLHKEDVGLCIGQKGSTAEAIRKVVGLVGYRKTERRVFVKIDAPKIPRDHFEYKK